MAALVSTRSTCARRAVGCVLVNSTGKVLSTGYNGVARGLPHCVDTPCPGASCASGTGLDACEAIHAEINALMQCSDISKVHTAYLTCTPCIQCIKALLSSNCQRIIASSEYPHPASMLMWKSAGREWYVIEPSRKKKYGALIAAIGAYSARPIV